MTEGRSQEALARIERALARIEAAAARQGAPAAANNNEYEELRRAHEALRGRVQSAVSQIDRLLLAQQERR